MARCDSCGNECTLPFTCQHCGGKFCPECRLPPNHQCTGITSWQKKPVPGVGMRYDRGGVTATGGGYAETRRTSKRKPGKEVPWLKVMIAIMVIIILGMFFLMMSGHSL